MGHVETFKAFLGTPRGGGGGGEAAEDFDENLHKFPFEKSNPKIEFLPSRLVGKTKIKIIIILSFISIYFLTFKINLDSQCATFIN